MLGLFLFQRVKAVDPFSKCEKTINAVILWSGHILGRACRRVLVAKCANGRAVSERTLRGILRRSRDTEYGRACNFDDIRSAEDYQKAVPLSSYDDYRPYIERMITGGEKRLITGSKVTRFATTTGTVSEKKLIPLAVRSHIPHLYNTLMLADDLYISMRAKGLRRRYGRGFITSESSSAPVGRDSKKKLIAEGVSSFALFGTKLLFPMLLSIPAAALADKDPKDMRYIKARYALQDPDIIFMGGIFMSTVADIMNYIIDNHDMLISDIEKGVIDEGVMMSDRLRAKLTSDLRPDPVRAEELRNIFTEHADGPLISLIWKDMSMISGVGTGDFRPFSDTLRAMCDGSVSFQNLSYASSEAVFGSVMGPEQTDYLIFPDCGFYEFIPVDGSSDRPLFMHELEEGKLYEIVVTNMSGLYRYKIRDIIRVTRFEGETPYIEFVYRADQITNLCGIHLNGEHLKAAVEKTGKELGIRITDYSIYADSDARPPRLELFFEAEGKITEKDTGTSAVFDDALRSVCRGYELHRSSGEMAPPLMTRLIHGTYMRFREEQLDAGASANQLKALRTINDKNRADRLRKNARYMSDGGTEN